MSSSHLFNVINSLILNKKKSTAFFADTLQDIDSVLEIANMENRKL